MKKLILLLFITLTFATSLVANNDPDNSIRIISGKILDNQTGEALVGVKIQVKGTDVYCYSDMNGSFTLTVAVKNTDEISIDMVGYESKTLKTQEFCISPDVALNPR